MNLFVLAQENNDNAGAVGGIFGMAFACVFFVIYIAILVAIIAGVWKMFVKAGEPGWAAIIPFYNTFVMVKICGKPILWFILTFIPCVNFIIGILLALELAKVFGKSAAYGIGIILLPFIFVPMLGFGKAQYIGTKTVF